MKAERDICDRLETMASTVHGGAYAVMHDAMREIKRLRGTSSTSDPVEAQGQREALSDEEIIAIRKSAHATSLTPWSDSIAFARAILAANERKT